MSSLIAIKYGDWYMDQQGNHIPIENCSICTPLAERIYPPGQEPHLPAHAPGYYGPGEQIYNCGCYYQQTNLTDQQDDPAHTHPDLTQAIRDLNVVELQKQLLELAAAIQALADSISPTP